MVLHKSRRYRLHISHSFRTHSVRSIGTSCMRTKALQYARVKQAVLLAAICALAFFSGPRTVASSATSGPVIHFFPKKLSFPSCSLGTTNAAQTISVSNFGSGILEITSLTITGQDAGDFLQTNNCGSSVEAWKHCTISVTFRPTATGSRSASLSITDNATGSTQSVALSGTGTSPTAAAIPTFSIPGGTYTSTQTVTISVSTPGATIYYTTNGTTPTTASTRYTGALIVNSTETLEAIATASGYSTSPVATATYTISLPVASLSPTSYAFPSQGIDTTSAAETFTLSNAGSQPLSITSLAITGANAGDFVAIADTCGSSLAADSNCTIGVTFTPSASGQRTASLTVTDNASGSPQTATLTGTGSPDVILSWGASPSSGVVGYNVYRGTTSGGEGSTPVNSTPINGTTYVDANVTAGTTYYYVVTSVGSNGVQSAPSNETEAKVPTS